MLWFSLFAAAVAPGISLLTFLYLKDRYDSEPIYMVVRMFLFGVLIVLPVMVLQRGFELLPGSHPLLFSFGFSAGIEEAVKWFIFYNIIFNHTEFDEPYDGIVYAAAISLGFATLENVLYAVFSPMTFGTLLIRALLPVSGHALFGITMGYYFGKAKFSSGRARRMFLAISIFMPVLWHGSYDWIITSQIKVWLWVMIPFMIFLWIWGLNQINHANARSPFRVTLMDEEVKL